VSLAVALVPVALLLWPAKPPEVRTDPKAVERVQAKIEQAMQSAEEGQAPVVQMDEAELNAWIQVNLTPRSAPPSGVSGPPGRSAEPTLQQVQSSLRDVKIKLVGDELRANVRLNLYGKDLTLQLEGRLAVSGGHVCLRPTRGGARFASHPANDARPCGQPPVRLSGEPGELSTSTRDQGHPRDERRADRGVSVASGVRPNMTVAAGSVFLAT